MHVRRAAMMVVTIGAAGFWPLAAIEIDGAMADWEGVAEIEMPAEVADSDGELDGLPLYTYQDSDPAGTWRGIFHGERQWRRPQPPLAHA